MTANSIFAICPFFAVLFVEADGTGETLYLRPYQNGGWDTDTLIRLERRER